MKKVFPIYKKIVHSACLLQALFLLAPVNSRGADTLYIPANASFFVHDKAQVSVFSSVVNDGAFGIAKGATLNMFGDLWRNAPNAKLTDELGSFSNSGGIVRFSNGTFPQYLSAGFNLATRTGASFTNLTVANPRGLYLIESKDAQVRGTLHFESGMFWLNDNNLVMGVTDPGNITGYTDTRFIGTGIGTKGGFVYRSKVSASSGSVVFPVGPQLGSYSPLSLMFNTTTPQDLHVRAFDEIYSKAFFGTTGSQASLQQTWNIGQENTTKVPFIIALQHAQNREGAAFTTHRGNSYISMFDFVAKTWDTLPPSAVTTPGSITTGAPLNKNYIHTRILDSIGQTAYLTKTADTKSDSVVLAKAALTPIRQPDGSFAVTYLFIISNPTTLAANNLQLLDTLSQVFKSPATFTVSSIGASGNLIGNKSFDGVTVTDLLQPSSTLASFKTDTVTLKLNVVTNTKETYFYNNASVKGVMNGFNNNQYVFNNRSVNGIAVPLPGAKPVPTPLILSESKYIMPQGFSPNGDGVNDRLIIGNLGNSTAALYIFDRQGTLVYRNLNYKNDWDGTYNQSQGGALANKKVEDGTYFYNVVITEAATGNKETYFGYISIWK